MKKFHSVLLKAYERVLRFFPDAFREEFEEDMLQDFAVTLEVAGEKGATALLLTILRELRDFPINLIRAHVEENRIFKLLRTEPANNGLRGAFGFGIVYGLTVLVQAFVNNKLYTADNSLIARLQVFFFDLFHTEHGLELISWIPSILSYLMTGLLLGILLAILFADRSKYPLIILAGMLGWFLHEAVESVLWRSASLGFFLGTRHSTYLSIMLQVLSGAFLGLIIVVTLRENTGLFRLLAVGSVVYPLIAYLYLQLLFKLSIITTPWMFIALMVLIVFYILSIFFVVLKSSSDRQGIGMIFVGAIGYLLLPYVGHYLAYLLSIILGPTNYPYIIYDDSPYFWLMMVRSALNQSIYGILFGSVMGLMIGFLRKSNRLRTIV